MQKFVCYLGSPSLVTWKKVVHLPASVKSFAFSRVLDFLFLIISYLTLQLTYNESTQLDIRERRAEILWCIYTLGLRRGVKQYYMEVKLTKIVVFFFGTLIEMQVGFFKKICMFHHLLSIYSHISWRWNAWSLNNMSWIQSFNMVSDWCLF